MSKHTPGTWSVDDSYYTESPLVVGNGGTIAQLSFGGVSKVERDANAAFIVKAVNCHDDLLEALKEANEYLYIRNLGEKANKLQKKLERAITKATGG